MIRKFLIFIGVVFKVIGKGILRMVELQEFYKAFDNMIKKAEEERQMKSCDLSILFEETIKEERNLLNTKGEEYTSGGDRLGGFKRSAQALGAKPLQVCMIFLQKHIDAIFNFAKTGGTLSTESIDGRIHDARNYLLLALALINEERTDVPYKKRGVRRK